MLWANRNGFVYVLDRETGEFLNATPFVRQTWNEGFDTAGRPRVAASAVPTPGGSLVYPSANSAANWRPASYSPELGLLFIAAIEKGGLYIRTPNNNSARGKYLGGSAVPLESARSFVAYDLASATFRWRVPGPSDKGSAIGGMLSLGDRLVLGAAGTQLFAMDARTGQQVWNVRLGGNVVTAPVFFRVEGQPRLAVTAGSMLFVLGLQGPPARSRTMAVAPPADR
jgi:alcohol dehydrogenase (cytochrome c)